MATNEVIAGLVRDLRPVRPLPLPGVRASAWAAAAAGIVAAVTALLGLRADLTAVASVPVFQLHVVLLLVAAIGSATAALASAVPGEPMSHWRRAAAPLAVFAWGVWLCAEVWWFAADGGAWWPIAAGFGCAAKAAAIGAAPAWLLIAMTVKAAPPDARRTGCYTGLAAAAVGAIGVEMTCPLNNPMHLLLWHAGPAVMTAGIVAVAAMMVSRRFAGLKGCR